MQAFKKFIAFMTQSWLLILIAITVFSLLIWYAGPLIAFNGHQILASETLRLVIIFVIFVAWGLNNLRKSHQYKTNNQNVANSILEPAKKADGKPNESQDESILSQRLGDAITTVQNTEGGKNDKLYSLPWYMIIGSPGSGKTTALKNSGLQFPLNSQFGDDPIQGAGGTRHCDWWFTDEAILIDTAGRYTTQDNPQKVETRAWINFLNRLKKSRPKRPLNGILVTVSLHDILNKTATQKTIQTTAIKRRIQELNNHLGMELPVYMVFTKTDIVAGFNNFFSDLDLEERKQTWGFTYPLDNNHTAKDQLSQFEGEYNALMARINGRVLHRLSQENNQQRRALIYEFPQQMNGLKQPIYEFLTNIFTPNQFETPFLLRGIYLTSSTQVNTASQRTTNIIPADQCNTPADLASDEPKTFFVEHLLKNIIFKEANIAKVNLSEQKRIQWLYRGAIAASVLVFIAATAIWYQSKNLNIDYIATVDANIDEYHKDSPEGLENTRDWLSLARGLSQLRALPTGYLHETLDPPLAQSFGLYQGEKIGSQAKLTYKKALDVFFMTELAELLSQQIDRSQTDEQLYEALKFYLMLYYPEKIDPQEFTTWVNILWERTLPSAHNPTLRQQLNDHLQTALLERSLPPAMDQQKVAEIREILARPPIEERLYQRLKNDHIAENNEQFNLRDVLGHKADVLFYRRSTTNLSQGIPEFFTYSGFHTGFNLEILKLPKILSDEAWIYGNDKQKAFTEEEMALISQQVRELYFTEYQSRWDNLINDLAIKSFSSANRGQSVLQVLSGTDKPLIKLLESIRHHTALSAVPGASKANKALADGLAETFAPNKKRRLERLAPDNAFASIKLPGQAIDEYFDHFNLYVNREQGEPLQLLQASLIELNKHLQTLAYANDINQTAFQSNQTGNPASLHMKQAIASAPRSIQSWFQSITHDTNKITSGAIRGHINTIWRTEVVSFFNKAIKGRYPVKPNSNIDIKLADFSTMFGPTGELALFSQQYIEPFVDSSRPRWRWQKNIGLSNQTLRFFERAERIRNAYFAGASPTPEVRFALRPIVLDKTIASFMLETAGSQVSYQHGPVLTKQVVWPGSSEQSKIIFNLASKGTPISARTDGEWSWFRLLDRYAKQEPLSNDQLKLTFSLSGIQAQYTLLPNSSYNPYSNRDITDFSLPATL
ncbi:MAG: type VI secretion system protein ImpL [Pseudohongiellaceae bacterium]|jgi:type VI secretion system protein ImpL